MKRLIGSFGRIAILLCAAPCIAPAQNRIWYAESDVGGDLFGIAASLAPDLDGDGIRELLIGSPGATCSQFSDGAVGVFSTSGGELDHWCGSGQEGFGGSLSTIDDVDGDGIADVVIGAPHYWDPFWGSDAGRVALVSGATGTELLVVGASQPVEKFGLTVAGFTDLNGDGLPEFLVGSPGYTTGSGGEGRVYVFSSKDGKTVRNHYGESVADRFGRVVCVLSDVDGDDTADYAVGARLGDQLKGRVYVYSGGTGKLIQQWTGSEKWEELGVSLAAAGDLDGDGLADLLCGGLSSSGKPYGYCSAYSPESGALIWKVEGPIQWELFGAACVDVGDMNGDGFSEFAVSAPLNDHDGADCGRVDLMSGKTLRPLFRFYPGYAGAGGVFGLKLTAGADFNQDSIPDLVVSAPGNRVAHPEGGRVSIYAGNDLFLQAEPVRPDEGKKVTLDIRGGEPGALAALVLVNVNGTEMFVPIAIDVLDANGELSLTETVPPGTSGYKFKLIGYAEKSPGSSVLIDTSRARVNVK